MVSGIEVSFSMQMNYLLANIVQRFQRASEVTTLWRYTNVYIIIIIIIIIQFTLGPKSLDSSSNLLVHIV